MQWRHCSVIGLLSALLLSGLLEPLDTGAEPVSSKETALKVGDVAPDFVLPDLNGMPVRLADYRGKKVVFLNFWAPWCPSCRFEMPTMPEVFQRFKDQGLEILAISIDQGGRQATMDYAITLPNIVCLFPCYSTYARRSWPVTGSRSSRPMCSSTARGASVIPTLV